MAKSAAMKKVAEQLVEDTRFREARRDNDTVRLWENYREQALLWRALALMQIPATVIALGFAIFVWSNRTTILNVPAKPLPGYYAADEIPDAEFIGLSTEFINLIATYQPTTAKTQFKEATKYLFEPMLAQFEKDMLGKEVAAIENTRRTQIFFVDPTKTQITRNEDGTVVVTLAGLRQKLVAGEILPEVMTQFLITLNTIPRNTLNPYGIVIKNVQVTSL
jgi:hypothetical protein